MDERNQRIREVFDRAVELSGEAREDFLRRECGHDDALRRSVELLLRFAPHGTTRLPLMVDLSTHGIAESPRALPDWMVAGTMIGPHELIRQRGRGGMGVVFVARHCKLGRLRAIKFLHGRRAQTPEAIDRFVAEGLTHARCQHQNIVVIHDVGTHEGCPYMVLEYLEGETLREWIRDGATRAAAAFARTLAPDEEPPPGSVDSPADPRPVVPPLGRVVEIMVDVVRALVHAHDQGIVHRDLKPENVMITDAGVVKVLDFGIATLVSADADAESNGPVAGTLPYMAPEQLTGDRIDRRADLWAIGVMFYELVTGRHPLAPFTYASMLQVMELDVPMPSAAGQMPGLGPLGPIIDRCLLKHAEARTPSARALLAELEPLLPRAIGRDHAEGESPFPGLAAFQESDADRFYGRDDEIARLVAQVRRKPLVAIAGPSGAGKSSLVRAGIIPALKRSGEGWDTFTIRPGKHPLTSLVRMVAQLSGAAEALPGGGGDGDPSVTRRPFYQSLEERLRHEPGYFGMRLRAHAAKRLRQVVLFIDQLEELHTLCGDDGERTAFAACVEAAADDPASPVRVIVTVRADFLDRVLTDRRLASPLIRGLEVLAPLAREGLRAALVEPLTQVGYRFESDELIDRMLDALTASTDVRDPDGQPDEDINTDSAANEPTASAGAPLGARQSALPLLQFTAARLWDRRDKESRLLTRASYDEIGGIEGALATHADVVVTSMPPGDVALARAIFERLVTPQRTRAVISASELGELGGDADVERVLAHLTGARLVTIEAKAGAGDLGAAGDDRAPRTVELVHESLIDRWPRLERWLHENAKDRVFLAQLRAAARQWEAGERSDDLLWRGRLARDARRWQVGISTDEQRRTGLSLSDREEKYLHAVVRQATRLRSRMRLLVLSAFCALVVFASVVSCLAVRADRQGKRAEQEAALARNAARMVAAQTLDERDPTVVLSILRELEAPPPAGWSSLARKALSEGMPSAVLSHDVGVNTAQFSPDGTRIVTACGDGTVRVWRADGAGQPRLIADRPGLGLASYSPDGTRVVTALHDDNTARVWSADGVGELVVLRGHEGQVLSALFSPDGKRVVTASTDHTVRLWNADGSGEPTVFYGHEEAVSLASFSPDGHRIVSASIDKTVRIWDVNGSDEPVIISTDRGIRFAVFDPDGKRILTTSFDGLAQIWNADGSGAPASLGVGARVIWSNFSPDGKLIVTTSPDSVRLWDADELQPIRVLPAHKPVWFAGFSPDNTRLVTASADGTARVWLIDVIARSPAMRGHEGRITSADFSPDGLSMVTAASDGTVRVWSVNGWKAPVTFQAHKGVVLRAAFSPGGDRILTSSSDGTVRITNADGSGEPIVLRGHEGFVWSSWFGTDGSRIVTASSDQTVRLWSADESDKSLNLETHPEPITLAAFSPDGAHIATASNDTTVRISRTDGSGVSRVLRGHRLAIQSAAFSPNGKHIVTTSIDTTVRVWNVDDASDVVVLRGHQWGVNMAAFSPDGLRIASASNDGTVRVWNADGSGEPVVLRGYQSEVHAVAFSTDGSRLLTGARDGTIRIWDDIELLPLSSNRLWAATDYCIPVAQRKQLLGVTETMARQDLETCQQRVQRARHMRCRGRCVGKSD